MPAYQYRALNKEGKTVKGLINGEDDVHVRKKIRSSGLFPVSITQSSRTDSKSSELQFNSTLFERVRSHEVSIFTRQMATLLNAGIPLLQALSLLIQEVDNPAMKRTLVQIHDAINEGSTFANALNKHPKVFSNIYSNMVRSGETSGTLSIVLDRLAEFSEKQQALQSRIQAALVYPAFMAILGSAILVLLLTYVVPNITQVFTEMEKTLPFPTIVLMHISSFFKQFWWLISLAILLTSLAFHQLLKKPQALKYWDKCKLHIPILGLVLQKILLARFASTLANLIRSGVDLLTSLQIVRAIINNTQFAAVIDQSMTDANQGKSITQSLAESPWFPPMYVQMISVGEQSGDLEGMLENAAKAYEREVEMSVTKLSSLIEPVMITLMGVTVLFIVLSILLPIFEMNQLVR